MENSGAWRELGQMLVERRLALGHGKRTRFAEQAGFANDRVLFDLEKGRRANYSPATLRMVEAAYRWAPGSVEAFVREGVVPVPEAVGRSALVAEQLAVVSGELVDVWRRVAADAAELSRVAGEVARLHEVALEVGARQVALAGAPVCACGRLV